ncbi:MAG TPA: CPBP family intramembrane glutamic endopeptidase [Natrialbaceae archaeon]|nr:CPBP family intramembrane glutamic endopeptidase [Natrialbaceae archaeon]
MRGRSIDATDLRTRVERGVSVPVATAWGFAFGATLLPQILADEVLGLDPGGLLYWQLAAVLVLFGLTFVSERVRPLRSFAVALFAVQATTVLDWSAVNALVATGIEGGFLAWVGDNALRMAVALLAVGVLFGFGYDRDDLFLHRGSLSRPFEPVSLPGLARARPWRWYAPRWGGGILVVTAVVVIGIQGAGLVVTTFSPAQLPIGLPLILLAAAFNSFFEEFVFRAAPLGELTDCLGKHHALVLLGTVWGFSHYYGTPSGVAAMAMGIVGGWFLGKSILETRGIGFAWGLHFLMDLVVFL